MALQVHHCDDFDCLAIEVDEPWGAFEEHDGEGVDVGDEPDSL